MAPPILKHKKKRLHPGCYWGGTAEFVIPTPSIDQVLQSLASNALASNASDENEDEDDTVENGQEIIQLEEGNNHNEESTSGLITAQPTSSADSLNDILSQAELRRSKRKQTFETQPTKLRVIVTGKKQATRANDTGKQNGCGLSRKFDKSHPTSSSRQHEDMSERTNVIINAAKDIPSSSRTVSDMLNDLIDRSVNQQQQNDIERQMSANNDSIQVSNVSSNVQSIPFIPEARLPNRRPAILVPSTMSQSKQSKSTRTNNAGRVRQVNASEARIAMTVDQVVSSLRKTASSSAAPVSFEQPLHFVIHQAPNTTSQTGNQPIQMQANAVEHDGDDDDIQVVEDEAEIEEVEDEAAPFCKNCANEVPLIIKRLDRLDGMVNRMIRFVKNELNSIPAATPSTGNNPVTTRLITTNNRPITITTPITTLDLEQKIMSGAPDEFDLHALCDRNTFVRGLTFDQKIFSIFKAFEEMQRSALVKIAPLIRARVSTYSLRNESTNTGIDPASDAYQFIQRSEIPTYHFQKSLRRLPIPTLEDTCRRYIKAVKAVFDENEAKETFKIVDRFLFGEAQDLQKELTHFDKRNPHTSYISEPWFDMYLSARVPCPINYNPFMMFAPDPEESFNNQLVRATNFVISCGRFKRALDAEILAPEIFHLNPAKSDTPSKRRFWKLLPPSISWFGAVIFKAFPLDMSQYKSLFGGCRIPQKDKDRLHLETNSRHFIVAKKGQFYSVELFDENGKLYPPGHVHACLHKILREQHDQPKDEECVGSLTTLDRDSWAEIRSDMIHTSRRNFESLRAIEDALFLLCLDDLKSMDPQRLAQALLCGDDGRNRWFDKCFQLIVDGNGQATINFEHSWGDGVAVLRLMEETLKDTVNQRFVVPGQEISKSVPTEKLIRKLGWELNESLRSAIKRAQQKHVELCANLDFAVLEHKALTKARIKDAKLSPDAIMQLGMQLAYHGIYQEFVPTYESCSTAAFLKGRTECIRSATVETREAVLAFEKVKVVQDKDEYGRTPTQMFENEKIAEPNRNMYDRIPTDKQEVPTPSKLYKLLRKCSDQHSKLVKEASMGQGFDRHLFGLKHMAQRLHRPYDEIFTDPIYEQMGHFVLSTSTLSTDTIYFGGFGPVVRDGFGVGYNVTDQKLGAAVTSYKDKRDAAEFCKALDAALNRIKDVIEKSGN